MGYSTHPALVEDNAEFLRELRKRLSSSGRAVLRIDGNVSTEQWRLRRILAACDRHPEALKGEFSGFGSALTIKVRDSSSLIVSLKDSIQAKVANPDETDMLEKLADYSGSMDLLHFEPSQEFDLDAFHLALTSIGWRPHMATFEESEDGTISLAVERIEERSSGFSFLDE